MVQDLAAGRARVVLFLFKADWTDFVSSQMLTLFLQEESPRTSPSGFFFCEEEIRSKFIRYGFIHVLRNSQLVTAMAELSPGQADGNIGIDAKSSLANVLVYMHSTTTIYVCDLDIWKHSKRIMKTNFCCR